MKKIECHVCKTEKEVYDFIAYGEVNKGINFEISICIDCWQNESDEDISNAIALFEQISIAHKDFTNN